MYFSQNRTQMEKVEQKKVMFTVLCKHQDKNMDLIVKVKKQVLKLKKVN